jgi:hypothetical protein
MLESRACAAQTARRSRSKGTIACMPTLARLLPVMVFVASFAPTRVEAENEIHSGPFVYVALGAGTTLGPGRQVGPSFRVLYRFERPGFAVDVSVGATLDARSTSKEDEDPGAGNVAGVFPRAAWVWFIDSSAASSPYVSVGASLSGARQWDGTRTLDGIGPAGELAVGYEWLRDSELRFFVEAGGSLPFYFIRGDGERAYAPTFFVLVGGAFDSSGF